MLSRDELVACLEQALNLARTLDHTALKCQGASRETKPQHDICLAVEALGDFATDEAKAKGAATSDLPVLALSGAAGIASATPCDHTQYAGNNIDTVAARNQQHYAGRSILQSASKDIEQFAVHGDLRSIANQGKIIHQAQHNGIEVTGERDITITSTKEGIVIRGKTSILLSTGDGSFLRLGDGQVAFGTKGSFTVRSASSAFTGPSSLADQAREFPNAGFDDAFTLLDQNGQLLPHMKYRLTNAEGEAFEGVTGADAKINLQKSLGPDGVEIELLGFNE